MTAFMPQPSPDVGNRRAQRIGGCSRQFGRASAPMMPQRVQTMRGPNVGTGA
jgi:hypothetical protein